MVKVTVIIPVYNTEKYLAECIESAINQSLRDIEIILVDDASPDNAGKICDEYAAKDSRIKVIHQENQGVSAARNNGLEHANGEYVYFLDSDDMIEESFLEKAYNVAKANDSDLTVCDDRNFADRNFEYICALPTFATFVKHDFLKQHPEIKFPIGIHPMEDSIFAHKILLFTNKISFCNNKYFYRHYPEQTSSVFRQQGEKLTRQIETVYDNLEKLYEKYNLYESKYFIIAKLMETETFSTRYRRAEFSPQQRKKVFYILNKFFKKHLKKYLPAKQMKTKFNYEFVEMMHSSNYEIFRLKRFLHSIKFIQENYLIYRFFKKKLRSNLSDFIDKLKYIKTKIKIIRPWEIKFINNFFNNIDENKVLVAEMNDCHNEVIPGYLKYLNELGYKCDVLIAQNIAKDNIFCNIPENLYENTYLARSFVIQKILLSPKIKKYKKILLTSNYIYTLKTTLSNFANLQDKNKFIFVEHNLKNITDELLNRHKYICLNNFSRNNLENNVVNPHYFGDIKITDKNPDVTKFIIIGRVRNDRQNYSLITDTIYKLKSQNIFNYKITIVGSWWNGEIDSKLRNEINLEYKGRLNFSDMYKEIEQADFFLSLFDENNPEHQCYKESVTSGQIQLIYGFSKPTIIPKSFAPHYGFNNQNAILFDNENDFSNALIKGIKMKNDEYKQLQNNLKNYADNVYKKSLENLERQLND